MVFLKFFLLFKKYPSVVLLALGKKLKKTKLKMVKSIRLNFYINFPKSTTFYYSNTLVN